MKYILEIQEDEELGGHGLTIVNSSRKYFNPATTPTVLAHDIMEHPARQTTGNVEDELMAIGGYYYIRYLGGWYSSGSYSRPIRIQDFTADIYNTIKWVADGYVDLADPKQYSVKDSNDNDFIKDIVQKGIKLFYSEENYYRDREDPYRFTPTLRKWIRGWIARGISYTKKRYKNASPSWLSDRFSNIERNLDPMFKSIDDHWEGFQYEVSIVGDEVSYRELFEEDDY